MCTTPRPIRNMSRPAARPMNATTPNSWRAAARPKCWKAGRAARNVVIEFASMEDALACYNSPEYTEARKIRQKASDRRVHPGRRRLRLPPDAPNPAPPLRPVHARLQCPRAGKGAQLSPAMWWCWTWKTRWRRKPRTARATRSAPRCKSVSAPRSGCADQCPVLAMGRGRSGGGARAAPDAMLLPKVSQRRRNRRRSRSAVPLWAMIETCRGSAESFRHRRQRRDCAGAGHQ